MLRNNNRRKRPPRFHFKYKSTILLLLGLLELLNCYSVQTRVEEIQLVKAPKFITKKHKTWSRTYEIVRGATEQERLLNSYSGSLGTKLDQKFKEVLLDFNLLPSVGGNYSQGFRAIIKIKGNLTDQVDISGNYEDSYNSTNSEKFQIELYSKVSYHWGVKALHPISNLKIELLNIQMSPPLTPSTPHPEVEVNENKINYGNLRLQSLSLVAYSNATNTTYQLEYKKALNLIYTKAANWYNPNFQAIGLMAFKYLVYTPVVSALLMIISSVTSRTNISRHLFYYRHNYMIVRDLWLFYLFELFTFLALTSFFHSFLSLVAIWFYFVFELMAQGYWLLILTEGLCFFVNVSFLQLFLKMRNPVVVKLTFWKHLQLTFSSRYSMDRRHHYGEHPRNRVEGKVGSYAFLLCFALPILVDSLGLWVLMLGLIYCLILFKYDNPSLLDYVSVIGYFSGVLFSYVLFLTVFKAIAVQFCYLQPFFSTWSWMVKVYIKEYLVQITILAVVTAADFFFRKNKFLENCMSLRKKRLKTRRLIKLVRSRSKVLSLQIKNTKSVSGEGWFLSEKSKALHKDICIINPLKSGEIFSEWSIHHLFTGQGSAFLNYRSPSRGPTDFNWKIFYVGNLEKIRDREALSQVFVDSQLDSNLIALVTVVSENNREESFIEIYNLRKRKKVLTLKYKLPYIVFNDHFCYSVKKRLVERLVDIDTSRRRVRVIMKEFDQYDTLVTLYLIEFDNSGRNLQKVKK